MRRTLLAAALLSLATLPAAAHTTVQSVANEGTTTYNNLVIGHGCTLPDGSKLPVVAQSVVFPTVNPVITVSSGTFSGNPNITATTTLAGIVKPVQSKDVFSTLIPKTDGKGNLIGWASVGGNLDVNAIGLVPFRTAGITFAKDSCITKLLVKIAVADVCQANGAKNLWIPSVTKKYTDPTVDGIGSPATLTIARDQTKNPLPSSCGAGYEVTVTPSVEDVDTNLHIDLYLP